MAVSKAIVLCTDGLVEVGEEHFLILSLEGFVQILRFQRWHYFQWAQAILLGDCAVGADVNLMFEGVF